MSEADKTRQKLVDSVQKTKSTAGDKSADETATKTEAPKRRATKKTGSASRNDLGRDKVRLNDPFQSQGRVWPD